MAHKSTPLPPTCITFNQDHTCICLADQAGITVYSLETNKICYNAQLGAVRACEMLFCSSLLAFVGAGEQPKLTPRKLSLLNTTTHSVIKDLSFPTTVLSVRMNRQRLVAVLERKAYIHTLESLELLRVIETSQNSQGTCAMCVSAEPCLLALPAQTRNGAIRIFDLMVDGGNVVCELDAHKSAVAAMAWNDDGTMIASASDKGTVLRVYKLPQAARVFSFRRGTYTAEIRSLSFSPPGVAPALLCAASGHGTVHLFRLEEPERPASSASGLLASVMPSLPTAMSDMVDPQRCYASLRLQTGSPAVCAILALIKLQRLQPKRASATSHLLDRSEDAAEQGGATLLVATTAGVLYSYTMELLAGPRSPSFTFDHKCHLLAREQDP